MFHHITFYTRHSNPRLKPIPVIFLHCRPVRDKCRCPKQKTAKFPRGRQAGDQCSECNRTCFAWRPASAASEKFTS